MIRIFRTPQAAEFNTSAKPMWVSTLMLLLVTLLCLPFLEIELAHTSPAHELKLMLYGLVTPDFLIEGLASALMNTVVFAVQAVVYSVFIGFIIAQLYSLPGIRSAMVFLRSIHELFWALILIQFFGLSTLTGVLALAIPFSATFARVFAEIQQETPKFSYHQIKGTYFSRFIYTTLPLAWPRLLSYSRYRLECALRASVILGFIGLPTLGFQLEGYLKLGQYQIVAALIYTFIALVLTMRLWANKFVLPVIFLFSIIWLSPSINNMLSPNANQIAQNSWQAGNISRFIEDVTPAPLKNSYNQTHDESLSSISLLMEWLRYLVETQVLPGIGYTVLLGQFAFVLSAGLGLMLFPLLSKHIVKRKFYRGCGNLALTSLRCLPELLLAFIALIFLGPSLLPGILAIGIHNGVLIAHLVGTYSNELVLRKDASTPTNSYFFEILPRIYGQFLSFTAYRGETILRETAILGILGIPTLGFYIDSAFEEFRLDRALILILVSALLNIFVEAIATKCRSYIHMHKPQNAKSSLSLIRN